MRLGRKLQHPQLISHQCSVALIFLTLAYIGTMEEQFIFRVPPSVAARLEKLLNEDPAAAGDANLDLSFQEDGRTGVFCIGEDHFPAALLDLPTVVESWKTYDDNALVKTADVGQMILVREEGDSAPEGVEFPDGLTPPMRDARRRRFRREADINPDIVQSVETDLHNVMQGGTAKDVHIQLSVPQWFRNIFQSVRIQGMVWHCRSPLVLLDSDALLEVEEEEAEEEGEEDEVGVEEVGLGGGKGTQESDAPAKREGTSKKSEGVVENGVKDGRGVGGKASGKGRGRLKGQGAKRGPKPKAINFHGSDDDYD